MTEIHPKLKKLIAKYLLRDLHRVEIIYYRDSIWFIDRENRYWYFEYHKVDKHLWWRWTHFTQALKMFSMDGEKEQSIFGELVNMILTKKQKLESKYPNKIFKTVGSVINFKDEVGEELNFEVEKTLSGGSKKTMDAHKVLDQEIKTTDGHGWKPRAVVDEVLNNEVKTTKRAVMDYIDEVDEVLNNKVETTDKVGSQFCVEADAVITFEVEKTEGIFYNDEIVTQEVLDFSAETTKSGELIEEDKIMDDVLAVEIEKIGHLKTHRLRPVTGALDYNPETMDSVIGGLKNEVKKVLDSTVEINSIEKLKGENPFQDIILCHILDESDKVTDKLKIKEGDYVKTYSHDVYMCDHLVQNVLDVGVNSIHYDAEPHTQLVDGILKKS